MANKKVDAALFVQEYLKVMDATAAYRIASGTKFSSDNSARVAAHKFITKPKVAAMVQAAMDKRAKKVGFDADRVLEELAKIAFSDFADLFKEDGTLKEIQAIDPVLRKAVMNFEVVVKQGPKGVEPTTVLKVKLWDKLSALDKLGRHLKLFHDTKVEVSDHDGGPLVPGGSLSDLELARKIAFILSKPLKKKPTK